jgi:hypothetical protein
MIDKSVEELPVGFIPLLIFSKVPFVAPSI